MLLVASRVHLDMYWVHVLPSLHTYSVPFFLQTVHATCEVPVCINLKLYRTCTRVVPVYSCCTAVPAVRVYLYTCTFNLCCVLLY